VKTTIYIQNLKCGGCAATIKDRLSKLKNISNVMVYQEYDSVIFEYFQNHDLENVKKELSNLGYPQHSENNSLLKKAKSFVSCAMGRIK
jgi:copper chaperone